MGNYYRWKKNKIVANEIDNPNEGDPIVVTKNYMLTKNGIAPKIVDGFFDFSDAQQITLPSIGSYKHLYDHYVAFSTKSNFYAHMGSQNSRIYRDSSDTVHFSFSNEYIVKQKPGQFISYVYSTDSSAYPDNGVSGSYYYNQKEEINSLKINTPFVVIQSQSIPISWSSVFVSGYEVTYQLQRKIDSSDWETIYTGSNTSYTDTAGIWTQVQYQVALSLGEGIGGYTQSFTIPVVSPQVLVISGQDGNLGTLTSNVPYTVFSNTGNPISLTRTVNGAQVVTLTVDSGFAYNIPIADLPTGVGIIQITASVESGSKTVTQTRTWTYYKTPINIPSTGGIAQLTQNGQNIWPVTVPDAVEAPVYFGGNLNAALNKLGQAALYTKIGRPKYNQVTVDLSKVKVGDEVLLPYNDVMIPHIVVHIGNPDPSMYDASCNGVWLLRKNIIEKGQWNSTNVSTLAGSTIMTTMQGYASQYDSSVSSAIKTVKIPYCIGGGNTTVNTLTNGLSCQIFPLSAYELGWTQNDSQYLPVDGTKLSYFEIGTGASANNKRIANYNNQVVQWWLRSSYTFSDDSSVCVNGNGTYSALRLDVLEGIRPCFIMPTTFNHTYYVGNNNSVYPSQEYIQGGSITDVFGYDVPICQYETGSYVGTGTYGSGGLNNLTFNFEPKFIMISPEMPWGPNNFFKYGFPWIKGMTQGISYIVINNMTSTNVVNISWTNNGVSWNGGNAVIQLNNSGTTYHYVAIG